LLLEEDRRRRLAELTDHAAGENKQHVC
jgi:hypothetical protein